MTTSPSSTPANRLIHETSPYLLQHAYNPVDWYPWTALALQTARTEQKPILLSIGYSACHWCHVMERESFENATIAALMNRYFICIKVDREERPDLDEIYMAATVAMNQGRGGWPMTVFLTPEQQPFFAGTYFPPEDRWGRPGFRTLLQVIRDRWTSDPTTLRRDAATLTQGLQGDSPWLAPQSVGAECLADAETQFAAEFDPIHGGFGAAPKFPSATGLALLLRCYRRSGKTHTLAMVTTTLDHMAAGGIYDHIGGGFARYSTDAHWLVPHFEKMLYDNALLAHVYIEAYQVTQTAAYRTVACEILDYVLREMTGPTGGFYSATDADSEGSEGQFFVWTPAQVQDALQNDEEARRVCACYDITEGGNWEQRNIPNRLRPLATVARALNVPVAALQDTLRRARPLLYQARQQRVPPALDDKVITAWNGMMLSAFAEAARVLGEERYRTAAIQTADFLLRVHRTPEGSVYRTSRQGHAAHAGVLEDYAYLAEGLLDLYEACGALPYLTAAHDLADRLITLFQDSVHGGFFTTATDQEALIIRPRSGADGAIPSGNAVAIAVLARLSFHADRPDFRAAATAGIHAYGRQLARYPRAFAKTLAVVDWLREGPIELVLIGAPTAPETVALQRAIQTVFLPHRIIASSDGQSLASSHPLLAGKGLVAGHAAVYLCQDFTCQRPLTDPQAVTEALLALSFPRQEPAPAPPRP